MSVGPFRKVLFPFLVLLFSLAVAGIRGGGAEEGPPSAVAFNVVPRYAFFRYMYNGNFGTPYCVFFDPRVREIYIADPQSNLVGIFDPEGFPLFAFGKNNEINSPLKVFSDATGKIYVLDIDKTRIKVFSYRGDFLRNIEFSDLQRDVQISTMAIAPNGDIFIAEHNSSQIWVFDPSWNLRMKFGSKGKNQGQFQAVSGIAVDDDGGIYVTDSRAIAVQLFDRDGRFLRGWGEHEIGPANFSFPAGIAVDPRGRIFVPDSLRQEIKVFDKEGKLIYLFGGYGMGPGDVAYPVDIAIDPSNRIYIAEKVGRRIQVFDVVESPPKSNP